MHAQNRDQQKTLRPQEEEKITNEGLHANKDHLAEVKKKEHSGTKGAKHEKLGGPSQKKKKKKTDSRA